MIVKNKPQQTLANAVSLHGIGLHSGTSIDLTLKPAEEHSGFVFLRSDLDPPVEIPALAQFVSKTERGTTPVQRRGGNSNYRTHFGCFDRL